MKGYNFQLSRMIRNHSLRIIITTFQSQKRKTFKLSDFNPCKKKMNSNNFKENFPFFKSFKAIVLFIQSIFKNYIQNNNNNGQQT